MRTKISAFSLLLLFCAVILSACSNNEAVQEGARDKETTSVVLDASELHGRSETTKGSEGHDHSEPTEAAVWGNPNLLFYRQVAVKSYIEDNGWVYFFIYENYKDPAMDTGDMLHYQFEGFNLRYRFEENYINQVIRVAGEKKYLETLAPTLLCFGYYNKDEVIDAKLISSMLDQSKTKEEILETNEDQYDFKSIDKAMFFSLMREALNQTPKEPDDLESLNKPSSALFQEPEFIDGYKFQIGFAAFFGPFDEIFIDVLYQTGQGYKDYIQLSDMADSGVASDTEKQAYLILKELRNILKGKESLREGIDYLEGIHDDSIDFQRLSTMLTRIQNGEYEPYIEAEITVSLEEIK